MKRIFPALLALLLVLSFTGCASRTTESSSSSSAASEKPAQSASPSPDVSESPNDTSVMPETALGLSAFRDALREAYGDKYYPDTKLTEDEIRSELGMDDSLYEEVYAENTAQKAHPDTFIAVKVKEGKTDEVKEKLAAYKQRLLADEDFTASKDKIEPPKFTPTAITYSSFCSASRKRAVKAVRAWQRPSVKKYNTA